MKHFLGVLLASLVVWVPATSVANDPPQSRIRVARSEVHSLTTAHRYASTNAEEVHVIVRGTSLSYIATSSCRGYFAGSGIGVQVMACGADTPLRFRYVSFGPPTAFRITYQRVA